MSDGEGAAGGVLFCLDGETAPDEVLAAISALAGEDARALAKLPELVAACLDVAADDQREARIARITRRDQLDASVMGPAARAVIFLLENAAAMNLDRVRFEADLASAGAPPLAIEPLLDLFDAVIGELRANIARATIAAHGPVVTGIEWRIDTVGSSSRGRQLDVPIALVTFEYRNGDKQDRFTLQMLPDAVQGLRAICDHLLGKT